MTKIQGATLRLNRAVKGPASQAILLAAATGIAQVIVAVIYVYSARTAGPHDYGLIVSAIALGTSAVGFVDFGTNSLWTRDIARGVLSRDLLGRRIANKLIAAVVLAVAWTTAAAVLFPSTQLWTAGPIAFGLIFSQSLQVPLRGIARNDLVALSVLLDKIIAGGIFWLLASADLDGATRLWVCLVLGSFASGSLAWICTPKLTRPRVVPDVKINPWAGSRHYGASTLASSAQALNLPALAVVSSASASGVFGAVNRWTQPMGLFSSAFVAASLPHVAKAPTLRDGLRHIKSGLWLIGVAIVLSLAAIAIAPAIVPFLLGHEFSSSVGVLQLLGVATILGIINQPLVVFLQARQRDRAVAWMLGLSMLGQLGLVLALGGWLGAAGAALALLAYQLAVGIIASITTLRLLRHGE
jgi:O-antigen/teichoic acid export membrane protein